MPDNDKTLDLSSNQRPQSNLTRRQAWAHLTAEYLNDLPQQLDQIRTMLKLKDYAAIKKHAHRIKGTSATYRLDDIAQSADRLQCLADTKNPDAIDIIINKLVQLVELHANKLNSLTVSPVDDHERLTNG